MVDIEIEIKLLVRAKVSSKIVWRNKKPNLYLIWLKIRSNNNCWMLLSLSFDASYSNIENLNGLLAGIFRGNHLLVHCSCYECQTLCCKNDFIYFHCRKHCFLLIHFAIFKYISTIFTIDAFLQSVNQSVSHWSSYWCGKWFLTWFMRYPESRNANERKNKKQTGIM